MSVEADKIIFSDENMELDWIQLRKDFSTSHQETTKEKMIRKIKANPLVPIGCFATATILGIGLYNFRTGNRRMSQIMMRSRIAAQGLTIFALVIGVLSTCNIKKD